MSHIINSLFRNIKHFIKNIFMFKEFLWECRLFDGDSCLHFFIEKWLKNMIKFYSNANNCLQIDESRLQTVEELKHSLDLLKPLFDEFYFLIDKDYKMVLNKDNKTIEFKGDTHTKEEFEEASKLYLKATDEFFEYLKNNYRKWWD
jgi:hypothetical protein